MNPDEARRQAETLTSKVSLKETAHWKQGYKSFEVSFDGQVIGQVEQEDHTTHKMSGRLIVKSSTKIMWVDVPVGKYSDRFHSSSRKKAIENLLTTHLLRSNP